MRRVDFFGGGGGGGHLFFFFFFKQKTAYEILTCDWSSDVCSSDLTGEIPYKDVDSTAIIWGVGSASLLLPIPDEMPEGFKLLLKQCW